MTYFFTQKGDQPNFELDWNILKKTFSKFHEYYDKKKKGIFNAQKVF